MSKPRYADLALYSRLLREARPYWPHILVLGLLSLLKTPLTLLTPLPLKIVVDSVIGSQPLPGLLEVLLPTASRSTASTLALALGLVVGIALVTEAVGFADWLLSSYTGEHLVLGFRARLFHHVQRLSLAYHDTKGTADSIYRIQYDAEAIQNVALWGMMPYLVALTTLIGMLYVTVQIDWQLSVAALAASPFLVMLIAAQRRQVRGRWKQIHEHQSAALAVVHEALAAVRVVKAFGQEHREQERFLRHSHKGARGQVLMTVFEGGLGAIISVTFALSTAVVLLIGVIHIQEGSLTLGDLLLVTAYMPRLYEPLELLSRLTSDLQSALASAERAFAVLDEAPDVPEHPHARPLARASGAVALDNVSFAYVPGYPVLHEISLEIPPGARVGIAGPTGAGKTTLVNLLTRFYDPTSGRVLLDGIDLRDYRLADLRNQFAIVLQEPVLFSTSIAENIAYARPHATDDEIEAAARMAGAHEFIAALPDDYDTPVGERGMRLSGGERQRISLARAFLKDAPLLILDEPTSSVDLATEATIIESMQRLMRGRTTFMIAHRLGTLDICDVRLVLDRGRLVSPATTASVPLRVHPGPGAFPEPQPHDSAAERGGRES